MKKLKASLVAVFASALLLSACGGGGGGGTGGGGGGMPPTPPPPQYVNVYHLLDSSDNSVAVIVDISPAEASSLGISGTTQVNALANPVCCGFTNPIMGGDASNTGYALYGIPSGDFVFTMVNGSTASGRIPAADAMCVTYQEMPSATTLPITNSYWKDYSAGNTVAEPANISAKGSCGTNSDDV